MWSLVAATLVYSTAGMLLPPLSQVYLINHFWERENTSPLVMGVSHTIFSHVASIAEGHARMNTAITSTFALYLT